MIVASPLTLDVVAVAAVGDGRQFNEAAIERARARGCLLVARRRVPSEERSARRRHRSTGVVVAATLTRSSVCANAGSQRAPPFSRSRAPQKANA